MQRLLEALARSGVRSVLAQLPAGAGGRMAAYAAGLRTLGRLEDCERLLLLDDSFVVFNPEQLLERLLQPAGGLDLAALTMVSQPEPRLQPYLLAFHGRRILASQAFRDCWDAAADLTDLALTRRLAAAGFRLGTLFRPDRAQCILAVCRALACGALPLTVPPEGPYVLDPSLGPTLDPTVYLWDELMGRFGILSLELGSRTRGGVNPGALCTWLEANPAAAGLFADAARGDDHALE